MEVSESHSDHLARARLYNEDLAPIPPDTPHLGHLQLRLALGRDERLHSHLHAGVRPDRRRHELVAGHRHHPAGQSDRADSHAAQRACGHEVRHSVSGARARVVRRARRERPRRAARAGGLRMVRHPDLDRRPGHLLDAANPVAALARFSARRSGSASSLSGR